MLRWLAPLIFLAPLASSSAVAAPAPQAATVTRFVRDPALLEAKEDQILAAVRQRSPEAATELQKLFSQDLIAAIAPELRRMGLDDQDFADITTVYWAAAWEASHGIVGRRTDATLVKGARDQIARVLAADPATARMSAREKQDVADTMLLQGVLAEARMGAAARAGPDMLRRTSDAIHAEASQILKTDLRTLRFTTVGFAPATSMSPAPTAPQPGTAGAPAAARPGAWAEVEGVYFRSYTGLGVGGMVTSDFEPLVFFRDGTCYEVEGPALEDVDLAASRRTRPEKWGRWARTADGFTLTDAKGRASQVKLQGGSFFRAFPAEAAGARLSAKYSRVSGGGNSALGGEMTIAAQTDLSFAPDGRYMRASAAGAVGSGDVTGVATSAYSRRAGGVGRYRIERHTITLTEPDGRTRRQFFAFGSRGTPSQPAPDMIFLGDSVYVVMD